MNIDLSKLVTNLTEEIEIDSLVEIPTEYLENTNIKDLKDIKFIGSITKLIDDNFLLNGVLSGVMILSDDVTLEDVDYKFSTQIEAEISEFGEEFENNLKIINNSLDILDFLWQNILVEVPSKVRGENKTIKLEGDGWRLISEDEVSHNNPFGELNNILNSEKGVK